MSVPATPNQPTGPTVDRTFDPARLAALARYDILDTGCDPRFEEIVALAVAMLDVPMATVSLIDDRREWFKARIGIEPAELDRAESPGAHALAGDDDLVITDTLAHRLPCPRTPDIRFYAAAIVRASGGEPLGVVSVMDGRPRADLSADRLAGLRALARLVEAELEKRAVARLYEDTAERFRDLSTASSDLVWDTDVEHRFVDFVSDMPGMAKLRPFALGKRRWEFRDAQPVHGGWADHIARLDAHKPIREFEYRLVTSFGEARCMRISGRPRFDRHGEFVGYRGVSSDITRQRAHERELAASEARFRNLVDSMVDVVFATNRRGQVTYASAAAAVVFGVKPEDLIGRTIASLLHPDDLAQLGETLHMARQDPARLNTLVVRGGTSLDSMRQVEVRFSATGEPDENGFVAFAGIIRDVEAQAAMQARQRDDMLKLRSIVESSGAMILLVDRDLRVVLANHSFLETIDRQLDEIVSRPMDDFLDGGIRRDKVIAWLDAGDAGRIKPLEFDRVFTAPDGGRRVVRVTASPVQDEAGRVNYVLFLGVDETARRSAEVQLLDAARLATVGQMATGMAHEINQPLTVLQFAVEGLAGEIDDNLHRDDPEGFGADTKVRLKRMEDQIRRASGIIRSLQGFAHRSDKQPVSLDVVPAIEGAVRLVDEQMRLAGIDLELVPSGTLPAIAGHVNRLQQVLINLVINARDAINDGSEAERKARGRGRIAVQARHDAARRVVIVEVADNGPGIPDAVRPRLFEPFFTTKPSGKGTGLGLSISSEIVRKMNGTIDVENRPTGGALFRLVLPVAPAG